MRRADIEVPNLAVAVNAWARSACYPRGSFYPISYSPSTQRCRITKADFRLCAACMPCSQAPFCFCTRRWIAIPPEGTIARLRYSLGGVRPRQTTRQSRSQRLLVSKQPITEWYFTAASSCPARHVSQAPTYATQLEAAYNDKL